jgi:hypothetical protein
MSYTKDAWSLAAALCVTMLAGPLAADIKFTTSWKAPGATWRLVAGQKVAVVVMTGEEALTTSAEAAMATALTEYGVTGEAAHRVVFADDLRDRSKAQSSFQKLGVKAVLTLRLVSAETAKTYSPLLWTTSPHYLSFYDYHAWGSNEPAVRRLHEEKVAVELLLFMVQDGGLAWAGTCVVKDAPPRPDEFAKVVVDQASKRLRKEGLLIKTKK